MRAKLARGPAPAPSQSRAGLLVPRLEVVALAIPTLTKGLSLELAAPHHDADDDDDDHGFIRDWAPELQCLPSAAAQEEDSRLVDELTAWMAYHDEADSGLLQELAVPKPEALDTFLSAVECPTPHGQMRRAPALRVPNLSDTVFIGTTGRAIPPPTADAAASVKRDYRAHVAIPRYLRKRATRCWTRQIMHESRSLAAFRRPRKVGKFHRTTPQFIAVSVLQQEQQRRSAMASSHN